MKTTEEKITFENKLMILADGFNRYDAFNAIIYLSNKGIRNKTLIQKILKGYEDMIPFLDGAIPAIYGSYGMGDYVGDDVFENEMERRYRLISNTIE